MNPKAESWQPKPIKACGRAAGVGTGQMRLIRTHPPLKAVVHRSTNHTWLPLEKWGAFLVFGRRGVVHG
jgi:hypothetical protein